MRRRARISTEPSVGEASLVVIAAVMIWGSGPAVIKLVSTPPLVATSVRFWITVPLVWFLVYRRGRRMPWPIVRASALAGAMLGVNLALAFVALHHASVAVVGMVGALQPGVVLLVAGAWLGERATRWHVVWTAVAAVGVVAIVLGGSAEVHSDGLGIILAVVAMFAFTLFLVLTRRARTTMEMDAVQWVAGMTLAAALTTTPVALAFSPWAAWSRICGTDWLYLAFLAIVAGIVGHGLLSWAQRFVPASQSATYQLMTPVVATTMAWPVNHEPVTLVQVLAGVVVLGAAGAVLSRSSSAPVARQSVAETIPMKRLDH